MNTNGSCLGAFLLFSAFIGTPIFLVEGIITIFFYSPPSIGILGTIAVIIVGVCNYKLSDLGRWTAGTTVCFLAYFGLWIIEIIGVAAFHNYLNYLYLSGISIPILIGIPLFVNVSVLILAVWLQYKKEGNYF